MFKAPRLCEIHRELANQGSRLKVQGSRLIDGRESAQVELLVLLRLRVLRHTRGDQAARSGRKELACVC